MEMGMDDSRFEALDKRLRDIETLLKVAYSGVGSLNTQLSENTRVLAELRTQSSDAHAKLQGVEDRLRRVDEAATRSLKIAEAVAKHLLNPAECAALGMIPDYPFEYGEAKEA